MKKILFIANYYAPYVSGVTEYIRQIAEALAARGYQVMVITSNHAKLPIEEIIHNVKVVRAPIICKINKGTISGAFILWALKYAKWADIVNLHLPMLESGILTSLIDKKKMIVTYHCDINLIPSFLNKIIIKVMDTSNKIALKRAPQIIVNTIEYMEESRIACNFKSKLVEISPPIKKMDSIKIQKTEIKSSKKIIGFCGRIVEEKGIVVLLEAYKKIRQKRQDVELIIGGDYKNVAGGSIYSELVTFIDKNNLEGITFTGKIPENSMESFYCSLDVFVLPSINSLESFGMVQVEAMMCGIPVVASDLLGVRTVVGKTGMGLISRKNNPDDLADKIIEVLENKELYIKEKEEITRIYSTEKTVDAYLKCFEDLIHHERVD